MEVDKYAVFGNPISQSKSPQIHKLFAGQTGEELEYVAQLVELEDFEQAAIRFFEQGGKGLNITVPFKQDAYAFSNRLSARARRAGAVNTLALQDDGTVLGDNTDGLGMVADITENLGWEIQDKNILMLGAGGAVRGVLEPVFEKSPKSLCIANRTAAKAVSLAKGFADLGLLQGMGFDELEGLDQRFDLIINGTSISLSGQTLELPEHLVAEGACAYDMMYGAEPTGFMQWAAEQGCEVSDGLGMLVEQAAESFYIWRGIRPNTGRVIEELRSKL